MAQLPRARPLCKNLNGESKGKAMTTENAMNWISANLDVVLALGSALVALVSALVARGETRRQRHLQEEELRRRVDQASLDWGHEAIDTMGEAAGLALSPMISDLERRHKRLEIARRLSALADRGRFFFPNLDPDNHGADKEAAFRGKRPPILDALIYAYHEVLQIGEDGIRGEDSAGFITECRRLLVSELQEHLDPRRLEELLGRVNDQKKTEREEALRTAGRLGVVLDVRRPGLLVKAGDNGWMDLIDTDERRAILHEFQSRKDEP